MSQIANDTTPTRIALKDYVLLFSNQVERAADDIAQLVTDPTIRRSTVYWKMRVIPLAEAALLTRDDTAAAIQLWVMAVAMEEALDTALGEQFGKGQPLAKATAAHLLQQARDLAKNVLKPEIFAKYEPEISKLVEDHVSDVDLRASSKAPEGWGQTLTSVLKTPLDLIKVPMSSLNSTIGLSDTALAMQNFTDEFSRARTEMSYMPRRLRWQAQLLLMETEETVNIGAMADGVAQVGASADSLAETAKTLPQQLRTELIAFAEELSKPQSELQATLREANTTLTNSQQTAQALDAMGVTWTGMIGAFDKLMLRFGVGEDDPAPVTSSANASDDGPPFDINDYGRTAEKLTETANALTTLLDQAGKITDAKEPPPLLAESEATARSIMDRFFLGSAALIVFWALVAYVYRVAVTRKMRS